jgi:hypothetical protein
MKRPALWLSYAFNPSMGWYVAIASSKHPDMGDDDVDVVAHSFEPDEASCLSWFERLKIERRFSPGD